MSEEDLKSEISEAYKLLDSKDESFQNLLSTVQTLTETLENLKIQQESSYNAVKSVGNFLNNLGTQLADNSETTNRVSKELSTFETASLNLTKDAKKFSETVESNIKDILVTFNRFEEKFPDSVRETISQIQTNQAEEYETFRNVFSSIGAIEKRLTEMEKKQTIRFDYLDKNFHELKIELNIRKQISSQTDS